MDYFCHGAAQQVDKLCEEPQQLEQNIGEQEVKIDYAIENGKPQMVISSYAERKARLVEEKKDLRQMQCAKGCTGMLCRWRNRK